MKVYSRSEARPVSKILMLKVFFFKVPAVLGVTFTLIGGLITILFFQFLNFNDFKFNSDSPVVKGKILHVDATNFQENKRTVYQYTFAYEIKGTNYKSISYLSKNHLEEDSEAEIEYIEDTPQIARIKGSRMGGVPFWVIFVTSPFLLLGLVFLFVNIKKTKSEIEILKWGIKGEGKFSGATETNVKINNRRVYEMLFELKDKDGKIYIISTKTHKPERLKDESMEQLVYMPDNPANAVLLDTLPKVVKEFMNQHT